MKTYHFKFESDLPIPVAEAWRFFSSPLNLAKITPPEMKFVVTSGLADDAVIYPGMLITYKVSPVMGIPLNWITEITNVRDMEYFVDEQRSGPYALWHHEHHFKAINGGVRMTDLLTYAVPLGILGRLANTILVENQVKKIFDYRETQMAKLFGVYRQP